MTSLLNIKPESREHKIASALRFLKHLHEEIELAQRLEDIQDTAILKKFQEIIEVLDAENGFPPSRE